MGWDGIMMLTSLYRNQCRHKLHRFVHIRQLGNASTPISDNHPLFFFQVAKALKELLDSQLALPVSADSTYFDGDEDGDVDGDEDGDEDDPYADGYDPYGNYDTYQAKGRSGGRAVTGGRAGGARAVKGGGGGGSTSGKSCYTGKGARAAEERVRMGIQRGGGMDFS